MHSLVETAKKWYLLEIALLDRVRDVFLLILRLYFGWGFISAGLGKLGNVSETVDFFTSIGVPFPTLNVYMAGGTETICGGFLLIGVASRLITIPLIGTMLVAYATAHTDQFRAFWGNTPIFFKAPPFPYLFTSLIVLLFGPGLISVDALIYWYLAAKRPRSGFPAASTTEAASHSGVS